MRSHGWQLPYHPLQVVAIAVFLALGVSFYIFLLPFLGNKVFQYVAMALYTPLVTCVFLLYIWCTATDPGDPAVFKSKKYTDAEHNPGHGNHTKSKRVESVNEMDIATSQENPLGAEAVGKNSSNKLEEENSCCFSIPLLAISFSWCPLSLLWICRATTPSSEQQTSEDGMFYCTLCEVEVRKYSKHCRVCDKCVDSFDHHCRWLNNCVGKRNYGMFFILMFSALLMLILQWSIGILVLVLSFIERKRFLVEITAKLGSSFSMTPFVIVVVSCTVISMIATLPVAQLFFFHVLLVRKGISTYDYIVALREQEHEIQGIIPQSPHMSSASSITGFSSTSSFTQFRREAWCTPPRLFLEDQFDVVPPEVGTSYRSTSKKVIPEEPTRKRNGGTVKISPWTLARLNAEDISRSAAEAKKKSKILQPVETRRTKRSRNSQEHPIAPLQLAARSAFSTSHAASSSGVLASSPDSSLGSPDIRPFRESRESSLRVAQLVRSTSSDGYEASGGEDSDQVPSRIVHRSVNWANLLFDPGRSD